MKPFHGKLLLRDTILITMYIVLNGGLRYMYV